ncbi:MAG: GtrA family protein [Clostridium sp.]|nr:GtrA family protein [Acetatifactor muris]MCM1563767.1 GtrA family protein [Clostridium sp.]
MADGSSGMRHTFKKFSDIGSQFIKFGAVGVINTVLSYLITNVSYYGFRLHEQICNLLSFVITVLISYLLNSRFVFRQQEGERQPWYKELAKVYASYALTELVLMGVLLFVQERLWGIPHFIATLVNLCVTVPLNFVLNKFWAYRRRDAKASSKAGWDHWIYAVFTGMAVVCGIIWSCTNLGYDSEYQIAMAYRLLRGDRMFVEMWEPHQTSALPLAALMWIYTSLAHTTTGIVLYLQICGILIRGAVTAVLYRTLRSDLDKPLAYGMSLLYFMIAPKDFALPDFSNLQLWSSTLLFCCIWTYLRKDVPKSRFLIAGSVFLCLEVLAYPSCVIVFPGVLGLLIFCNPHGRRGKDCAIVTGVCAVLGLVTLACFTVGTSPEVLVACVKGMLALEPTHTVSMAEKWCNYGKELLQIGAVLAVCGVIGWGIGSVLRVISGRLDRMRKSGSAKGGTSQDRVWESGIARGLWMPGCAAVLLTGFAINILSAERRYAYSVILLFIMGLGLWGYKILNEKEKNLYICGTLLGVLGLIATLFLTNLPFPASVPYALLAVICAMVPILRQVEKTGWESLKRMAYTCFLCFVALLAFRCVCVRTPLSGKGQICSTFSDLSVVRDGPALGIISDEAGVCVQRDSYPEWKEYIREGDKVWIVGSIADTLGYLYEDVEVAAPSTTSTPSYSEAVLEYWRLNPDKYPDVIVAEGYMGELSYELLTNPWFLPWIEEEYRPEYTVEGKYWTYFFREKR